MSWLISIIVALITAILCGAGVFWLSLSAMSWYRVTSFEGASGYATVGLTIIGTVGVAVLGFIAARVGAGFGWTGFGGQLLCSLACGMIALGIATLITRALADVPPKLNGQELDLLLELRLPEDVTTQPTASDGKSSIELGAMAQFKRVVRKREAGTLLFDQVRLEEGRWILPARLPVFTSRGKRILLVELNGRHEGFLVPLPSHPSSRHTSWSEWLPEHNSAAAPNMQQNKLRFRYRVQ